MIEAIELKNRNGHTLRGYLNRPENYNGVLVVYFHGFTGNLTEHGGMFRDFSRFISNHGFASIRFDFYGNGESDGNFSDFSYDTLINDAHSIIRTRSRYIDFKNTALVGFSMGGAVAAYMAGLYPNEIDCLLLWSPAGNLGNMIKKRYENAQKLESGNVDCPNFGLSKALYQSVDNYQLKDGLDKFLNPVKIIQGKEDQAVNYLEAYKYYGSFSNASLRIINSAGHGYDRKEEREELFIQSFKFLKGILL